MKLSIIIPTHNNLSMLKQCIDSIFKHTNDFQIFVYDNASTDGTAGYLDELHKRYPRILCTHSKKNVGFASAINAGINLTDGEIICWLNDDTLVTKDWAERLIDCLMFSGKDLGLKKVGIVGPMTNSAAGKQAITDAEINILNFEKFAEFYCSHRRSVYEVADFVSGFCLMHTRALAKEIGILDESFGLGGFEDNDFLLRAELAGYRGVICHDSFVFHHGSATLNRPGFQYLQNGLEPHTAFLQKYRKKTLQKLVTTYIVHAPHPVFAESVAQAASYSDEVSITFDNWNDPDLETVLCEHSNVHIFHIKGKTYETQRRNIAINNAKTFDPDWILSLDSDELLESKCDFHFMHRILLHPNPHVKFLSFPVFTFWNDFGSWRVDSVFGKMYGPRLFKCLPDQILFSGHPQGYHVPHVPHASAEGTRHVATKILHYGYVEPDERMQKFNRYTSTDTSPDPEMIGSDDYSHIVSSSALLHEYSGPQTVTFNMMFGGEYNEAAQVLDHIFTSVDEIVMLSTVKSPKFDILAKLYHAVLLKSKFKDDFSAPRNLMKQHSNSDWILYLDPDETLHWEFFPTLQRLLDEDVHAFLFTVRNLHREGPPSITDTVRMFRNLPSIKFRGRVHENLDQSLKSPEFKVAEMPWELLHYGYINPRKDEKKSIRLYTRLAKKSISENPRDPLAHFNLALCVQNEGDPQGASDLYRKAAELDKNYYHPRLQLALIHLNASIEWFMQVQSLIPPEHRLRPQVDSAIESLSRYSDTERERI